MPQVKFKDLPMKNIYAFTLSLFFMLPLGLDAQVSVTGEVSPAVMLRIKDASPIDLPFRLGTINLDYAMGDFELKTTTSLETRWQDPEFSGDMLQFREAYLMWYPSFGEIKVGKMIHAWGAADANNPTDNLSPYDYYYMFLTGTDRKQGNFSLSASGYFEDWQGQAVFTPEFKANRFPFGEPDFPISFPFEPDTYEDLESPVEYGVRVQRAFNAADISISYLKSHDQSFSLLALEGSPPSIAPRFGYRNTNVLGLDFVAFPGNWTIRGESGYFQTETPEIEQADPGSFMFAALPVKAEYLQYVFQLEYQFANQVSMMAQLLGTKVIDAEGLTPTTDGSMGMTLLNEDNFSPGLGTPFAMISDQVIMFSTMATLMDNALELNGMLMVNLAETGYMANAGATYSVMEGLNLEARLGYFLGGDEEGNRFSQLEDFSNVNLGLSYNF